MTSKETPKINRFLELAERERAYKNHLKAVADAKPTIDTSHPEVPNRLKLKSRNDALYRKKVMDEYAARDKIILDEKEPQKEVDAEQFLKEQERPVNSGETIRIGFDKEPIIQEHETKVTGQKSRIPQPSRRATQSPKDAKQEAKPTKEKRVVQRARKTSKHIGSVGKEEKKDNATKDGFDGQMSLKLDDFLEEEEEAEKKDNGTKTGFDGQMSLKFDDDFLEEEAEKKDNGTKTGFDGQMSLKLDDDFLEEEEKKDNATKDGFDGKMSLKFDDFLEEEEKKDNATTGGFDGQISLKFDDFLDEEEDKGAQKLSLNSLVNTKGKISGNAEASSPMDQDSLEDDFEHDFEDDAGKIPAVRKHPDQ